MRVDIRLRKDAHVSGDVFEACLLWDIDGTLVRHAPSPRDRHAHAVKLVLQVDAQPVQLGTGKTDRQLVMEIISAHTDPVDEVVDAALLALDEITAEDLSLSPSTAIPGVARVLESIPATDVQQRLLTGNTPRRAELKVRTSGLHPHFEAADGFYGDRHPTRFDLVRQAAENFDDATIERTIIVGDTPLDIAAARSVGFRVIAVATGTSTRDELADHRPDALLDDFNGGPEAFMDALRTALAQ
jgi:phosphoglycolate phosphatase-like HAD superfamily hydrolase